MEWLRKNLKRNFGDLRLSMKHGHSLGYELNAMIKDYCDWKKMMDKSDADKTNNFRSMMNWLKRKKGLVKKLYKEKDAVVYRIFNLNNSRSGPNGSGKKALHTRKVLNSWVKGVCNDHTYAKKLTPAIYETLKAKKGVLNDHTYVKERCPIPGSSDDPEWRPLLERFGENWAPQFLDEIPTGY